MGWLKEQDFPKSIAIGSRRREREARLGETVVRAQAWMLRARSLSECGGNGNGNEGRSSLLWVVG